MSGSRLPVGTGNSDNAYRSAWITVELTGCVSHRLATPSRRNEELAAKGEIFDGIPFKQNRISAATKGLASKTAPIIGLTLQRAKQ